MQKYYVYIIGKKRPTLYVGVTNNLIRRVYEHRNSLVEGFSKRYELKKLLYFEVFDQIDNALLREKQLKHWNREWKLNLIRTTNSKMEDLYGGLLK